MNKISLFDGEYRFLSNFYQCTVRYQGTDYPSVENAYQSAKTCDYLEKHKFVYCTPGKAKRLGRLVDLRKDWEFVKLGIMYQCLSYKFSSNDLQKKLIKTGAIELEEGNNWGDRYWGTVNGVGENHLGKILMRVRHELLCKEGI